MRLDRIGPRRVRGREAQLDVLPPGPAADGGGLVRRQVVHDHEQPVPAGPGGPDGLQRGQGVIGALVLAGHAPQLVIADAVAAVEVADAVGAVVGGAQPGRAFARRPAGAVARAGWTAARTGRRRSTGPGNGWSRTRSGPAWRPGPGPGLFPGPGPLEGDAAGVQDLPQPLPPDPDRPVRRPLNSRPACAGSTG